MGAPWRHRSSRYQPNLVGNVSHCPAAGDSRWNGVVNTWDWELSLSLQESRVCVDELLRLQTSSNQHHSVNGGLYDPLAPARFIHYALYVFVYMAQTLRRSVVYSQSHLRHQLFRPLTISGRCIKFACISEIENCTVEAVEWPWARAFNRWYLHQHRGQKHLQPF